jgi:hypothetical protein
MNYVQIKTSDSREAKLFRGRPLADCPKSYKRVCSISHNIGNNYNPSYLVLYRAKDKSLRYEIFRDGCFYPYYGRFEWIIE